MTGPAKNRLRPYEAGWLTFLIKIGVATEREARAAQTRVAQAAIDDSEAERKRRRAERTRKPDRGET
jgi:hypothetical protein